MPNTNGDVTLSFKVDKVTKNTFRFAELKDDGDVAGPEEWLVGSIYVHKRHFNNVQPQVLQVTIHAPLQ